MKFKKTAQSHLAAVIQDVHFLYKCVPEIDLDLVCRI